MVYCAAHRRLRASLAAVMFTPALAVIAFLYSPASVAQAAEPSRPPQWAVPIPLPGAANLHKMAEGIYRSAQPTAAGMKNLEKMGSGR